MAQTALKFLSTLDKMSAAWAPDVKNGEAKDILKTINDLKKAAAKFHYSSF